MSGSIGGLSETGNLSKRQASILSKKRAAEELELARQQELEAEAQEAERCRKIKKDNPPAPIWTEADKDVFLNSVIACGRDFDKIYKICVTKMSVLRPLPQIRRYYASIVRNVQSAVNMSTVSKDREANELFAIINWAEFRRRMGAKLYIITKHREKLRQLIYTGETRIRRRGKKFSRIRTPVCPPLTQLMDKARGEMSKDTPPVRARIPPKIILELKPKTNAAWHRVTDISHNPHLRLNVRCGQSLSTVIEALERKWVPSTVRSQRELALQVPDESNKLPYIKVYPVSTAKLQPFDLSLCDSNSPPPISFDEYLRLNHEDVPAKETEETNSTEPPISSDQCTNKNGDPVKFLKDKLDGITSLIKCESTDESGEQRDTEKCPAPNTTKSHEWIAQSTAGWTIANSKNLSMGEMYLLFDSPAKVELEYEWPELETADEVVHMFAGMINKLISMAQNEFGKKKSTANAQTSPTTKRSPSTRGKRPSPSTPKSLKNPVALKPALAKDSPEFKKPGVPLQSENKQLADAIALGRQELLPYARRLKNRPKQVVQKNILPNRIAVPIATHLTIPDRPMRIAPHTSAPSTKTHVMDVSCIAGRKYSVAKRLSSGAENHQTRPRQSLQALINRKDDETSSDNSLLAKSLSSLINGPSVTNSSDNAQLAQLQSLLSSAAKGGDNREQSGDALDLLAQAMNTIETPAKRRRITPTMISSTVEGGIFSTESIDSTAQFPSTVDDYYDTSASDFSSKQNGVIEREKAHPSDSQMSLNSLLRNISAGAQKAGEESVGSDISLGGLHGSGPLSFRNLIPGSVHDKEHEPAATDLNNPTATVKDAWLTPDVAMTDFSFSALLGDKSPRRTTTESAVNLMSERPTSTIGSDDTRLSFLNRLDVGDLGMGESSFPMLSGDSVDYMLPSLETPQKKAGAS